MSQLPVSFTTEVFLWRKDLQLMIAKANLTTTKLSRLFLPIQYLTGGIPERILSKNDYRPLDAL